MRASTELAPPRFRPADAGEGPWEAHANERVRPVAWLVHRSAVGLVVYLVVALLYPERFQ